MAEFGRLVDPLLHRLLAGQVAPLHSLAKVRNAGGRDRDVELAQGVGFLLNEDVFVVVWIERVFALPHHLAGHFSKSHLLRHRKRLSPLHVAVRWREVIVGKAIDHVEWDVCLNLVVAPAACGAQR